MKWVVFVVVLAAIAAISWHTGLAQVVASPFKAWLRWIGA